KNRANALRLICSLVLISDIVRAPGLKSRSKRPPQLVRGRASTALSSPRRSRLHTHETDCASCKPSRLSPGRSPWGEPSGSGCRYAGPQSCGNRSRPPVYSKGRNSGRKPVLGPRAPHHTATTEKLPSECSSCTSLIRQLKLSGYSLLPARPHMQEPYAIRPPHVHHQQHKDGHRY